MKALSKHHDGSKIEVTYHIVYFHAHGLDRFDVTTSRLEN